VTATSTAAAAAAAVTGFAVAIFDKISISRQIQSTQSPTQSIN